VLKEMKNGDKFYLS